MESKQVRFGKGFKVLLGNRRVQAAQMVIPPGKSEGGPGNRHRGSDQWLFVIAGRGIAMIKGRRIALKANSLILIEHCEQHEIRNTGSGLLKTPNLYSPLNTTRMAMSSRRRKRDNFCTK
jgi:mannose-6-phosphate isomerase-like protein (cupin superfamily)